ncbi:MAG: SagB/ThcOx family dehydrogenase [Anaerolineales bacterium]|nr:SagB/ThcOx family dehydrogenase [Anaerolineales bacterium]
MAEERFTQERYFLKDLVRHDIDFSQTDQRKGLPAPPLQKPCPPELPRVDLPDGAAALEKLAVMPVGKAILLRESIRSFTPASITLEELAALLWATQGVRRIANEATALRTVPSAGSRHTFETYLTIDRVGSLEPGLYRFLPFDNQLARLADDQEIAAQAAKACLNQNFVAQAAVNFFWTTVPARMEWRYNRAAHKVIAVDAGHVCQNLYLACESLGMGTCAIGAYDQEACDSLLGVDGGEEFTIYIAPVGKR